jgi:hypothetical protein
MSTDVALINPGVFLRTITLPANKVLEFPAKNPTVDNSINFELLISIIID